MVTCPAGSATLEYATRVLTTNGWTMQDKITDPDKISQVSEFAKQIASEGVTKGTDMLVLFTQNGQGYLLEFINGCNNSLFTLNEHGLQIFMKLFHTIQGWLI